MSIVQDEANRVNAYQTTMCDLEYNVNLQIADWGDSMNIHGIDRYFPDYRTRVQSYWREVYGIDV